MRPAHWIGLNIKPLEKPGVLPFPNPLTIPINVNKSYVAGRGKTIPIMFYYIFILWTGLLDDSSALLQNHQSLGKTSPRFPFFVLPWCHQIEKSEKLPTSQTSWACLDYRALGDSPVKMPTAFLMSRNYSFAEKREKMPEGAILHFTNMHSAAGN